MVRCRYLEVLWRSRFVEQLNRKRDKLLVCKLKVLLVGNVGIGRAEMGFSMNSQYYVSPI